MSIKWYFVPSRGQPKRKYCVPGSKSHTIRAIAVASLAKGQSTIRNPLVSNDTLAAVYTYRALGAKIDTTDSDIWKVTGTSGQITTPREDIYVGNSGLTLRIAMGSASLAKEGQTTTFTGDKQLQNRPIGPLMEALNNLGARCNSIKNNDKAPVEITSQLAGGKTTLAAFSSQYLTSLLLCAPLAARDSEIDVTLLNEPGYVQITLDWLDRQGIEYQNENMQLFKIKGQQKYTSFNRTIPADFSTATFFFCAAVLLAQQHVTITGLDFNDSQPDKKVVSYLKRMGADIREARRWVEIRPSRRLKGITIDMNDTHDALPAMAVTAIFAEGTTTLLNVPQARGKETDRIKCMAEELKKLGIDVKELSDGLVIKGGIPKPAIRLDGRKDHRLVMALSIALLRIGSGSLLNVGAYTVTFPKFLEFVDSLGGTKIEAEHSPLSFLGNKCAAIFQKITGKKSLLHNIEHN